MLRPSKKLALAVEAVVDIAIHGGIEPVQSQDIARRLELPRRYLEQVMQQLVRAGILRGVRGPRGGYRLAREQRRVSIGDIFRVVQRGEETPEEAAGSAGELGQRVMIPFWSDIEAELMTRLDAITIEDLCRRAHDAGITASVRETADFAI